MGCIAAPTKVLKHQIIIHWSTGTVTFFFPDKALWVHSWNCPLFYFHEWPSIGYRCENYLGGAKTLSGWGQSLYHSSSVWGCSRKIQLLWRAFHDPNSECSGNDSFKFLRTTLVRGPIVAFWAWEIYSKPQFLLVKICLLQKGTCFLRPFLLYFQFLVEGGYSQDSCCGDLEHLCNKSLWISVNCPTHWEKEVKVCLEQKVTIQIQSLPVTPWKNM